MKKIKILLATLTLPLSSVAYSGCSEPRPDSWGQISPFAVLAHTLCLDKEKKSAREREDRRRFEADRAHQLQAERLRSQYSQ